MGALRLTLAALALIAAAELGAAPVDRLYAQHCAVCHGPTRLGGTGPALLPENLQRLRRKAAVEVIAKGRIATQMLGFADKLSAEDIRQLADYIYLPPAEAPRWTLA
ncbi:MAG TPA: cytochrome c, partial [Burkholderiales bacterium]|nr:cytochrome c [Burkholderiales bacterium]